MKKIIYTVILHTLIILSCQLSAYSQVTLTTTAVAAASANQGTSNQVVYVAKMATTAAVTVNSAQFTLSGTHDANDLNTVRVYFNPTNPTVAGSISSWGAAANFAAPHTYSININRPMDANTSGYFLITVDIDASATDEHTVTINGATNPLVFGFTTAPTVTNSQTDAADDVTIQAADVTLTSSAVPASNANQGTGNQIVYAARMQVSTEPLTANSVQFTLDGTHDVNDLNTVRVYFNPTNPTVAGSISSWGAAATFAAPHTYSININRPMDAGSSGYFIITVDVDNFATDENTVSINGATNPLVFGFTTAPNVTNSQTDAAGDVTIQAPDVTLTSSAIPAADANQGTSNQIVYAAKMQVSTEPLTANAVQFTLDGTHDANDLNTVRVYFNPTNPTVAGSISSWGAAATFAAPHTYSININRPMDAGSSGYFIITVDIDNFATDENTVSVDGATNPLVFGFTTAPNITNSQTDIAGNVTIQAPDVTLTSSAIPAANANQGTSNQIVYAARMQVSTEPLTANSVQFTLDGTHDANDLTTVRVYFNPTNPTVAGSISSWGAAATFAAPHTYSININRPMDAGSSGYFIITIDIDNFATDENTVSVNGATNPLVFGFTTAPNVTNSQTDAAGDITIQAADVTLSTTQITESGIVQGESNKVVEVVKMEVETEPVTVNSVQFVLSGTHDADDLSTVRVYFNPTAPTVAGSISSWGASAAFAAPHTYTININRPMDAGSSGYYIITVDVTPTATTGNTVTINGATDPVIFGFTTSPNIVNNQTNNGGGTVPVKLISFTAVPVNSGAELRWITATELNNDHFVVEYSTDGIHFNALGTVKGKGTISAETNYSFLHTGVANGVNYYRLNQIDANGQSTFSNIARLELKINGTSFSSLYPNPVQSKLFYSISVDEKQQLSVRIMTNAGATVLANQFGVSAGIFNGQLNLSGLTNGVYYLQLINNKGKILEAKKIAVMH